MKIWKAYMRLIILAIVLSFVAYVTSTEYNWGEPNLEDDYLIADDTVSKRSWLFKVPKAEYVFKQKKDDRLTISGISIVDPKGKCNAEVTLTKGGIGKKTATLKFVGKAGKKFKCRVKIWGYQ
ncbi:uncharacterized protein LOC129949173 [Eupeodes corollae]|uniref:uncharacterized protein LOC129949173 n=1 Tax=Eupeodes corollae TaxID=290404 RepID=UPI0024917D34|nr:uncharacterized protein LOC129949173 [Eupeodes corollae]